jgi:hypothetical protein
MFASAANLILAAVLLLMGELAALAFVLGFRSGG